jgi:phosphoribosylformylglycinamidine synthase
MQMASDFRLKKGAPENFDATTTQYPFNPNGSPVGLTAVTTQDGRFTDIMSHPERVFRNIQMSWTNLDSSAESMAAAVA